MVNSDITGSCFFSNSLVLFRWSGRSVVLQFGQNKEKKYTVFKRFPQ